MSNNTAFYYSFGDQKSKINLTRLKSWGWQRWFYLEASGELISCLFQLYEAVVHLSLACGPISSIYALIITLTSPLFNLLPSYETLWLYRTLGIIYLSQNINLVISLKSILPCNVTYSQVLGIRRWISLRGGIIQPITGT